MKLVVFNNKRLGSLQKDGSIIDLNLAFATYQKIKGSMRPYAKADAKVPSCLLSFIKEGKKGIQNAEKAINQIKTTGEEKGPNGEKLVYKPDEAKIKAPLPSRASKIAMAGANFYDHSADVSKMFGRDLTIEDIKKQVERGEYTPWGFWKQAGCVIGPYEPIIYPSRTQRLDYEVEVAAILGNKVKDVNVEEAMRHIYGYTIINDISIRDTPRRSGPNGLFYAKNFDGCAPMGPCIVTADEIGDPHKLKMRQTINGVIKQDGTMESIIRGFDWWLSYLTRDMTFYPGDIICGGTCSGTAFDTTPILNGKTKPDNFLKIGDTLEAWVEKIGTLQNKVVKKP